MDQIEMSNPYKGATIDAFYQVSCHLALSGFRGKAVLEIDPSETIIAYGGHVCKRIKPELAILIEDIP